LLVRTMELLFLLALITATSFMGLKMTPRKRLD